MFVHPFLEGPVHDEDLLESVVYRQKGTGFSCPPFRAGKAVAAKMQDSLAPFFLDGETLRLCKARELPGFLACDARKTSNAQFGFFKEFYVFPDLGNRIGNAGGGRRTR